MFTSMTKVSQLVLALFLSALLAACGSDEEDRQNGTTIDEKKLIEGELTQRADEAAVPPATPETTYGDAHSGTATESDSDTQSSAETGNNSASSDMTGSAGNADNGEKLFNRTAIGSANAPGCVTCHSLEPGVQKLGPSLANVASTAADRVENLVAEGYLRQSITEPNAHVVEGFPKGVMYQMYGEQLDSKEIDDLVAFLMTQK